jgi:ribosomal protein L37AE/L43A
MPFRVVKRHEGEDTLDLSKIFKSEITPEVVAVIVRDPGNEEQAQKIRTLVEEAGFAVAQVKKADNATVYQQKDQTEDVVLVRLSENVVLAMTGFNALSDEFRDMVGADGFFNGITGALQVAQKSSQEILQEETDPAQAETKIGELFQDLKDYATALVHTLPPAVFKAEAALEEVFKAGSGQTKCPSCDAVVDKDASKCPECGKTLAGSTKPTHAAKKAEEEPKDESSEPKEEPKGEPEDEPKEPADKAKGDTVQDDQTVQKQDDPLTAVLVALQNSVQSIATKVDGMATQVQTLTASQADQKKVVDELVSKSETLSEKLSATVAAPPRPADAPTPINGRAQTQKSEDEDPRTGVFDTAFLPRRNRGAYR